MSTLVVETIKHTNDTTLFASDTSGQLTVKGEGTNTTNLQQGIAKSWCKWQSTSGTASVTDSFNHSSIVDNGTGDQTITITTAMASVDCVHAGMAGGGNTNLAAICHYND